MVAGAVMIGRVQAHVFCEIDRCAAVAIDGLSQGG
jgi:hypothetical protein